MTSWKVYILCATILPLAETKNNQRGYKLETTTTSNQQESLGCVEMSEEHKIKVGNRIEPVIFEPQWKIKLSRSTYKVASYVDFKPYKQSFKQFGQYIGKFLVNLHDPNYVSTLYNVDRCATILPLAETKNNQRGYKLETTTTSNQQESLGCVEMSEEHKIKVGNRIEPVIFEPQ